MATDIFRISRYTLADTKQNGLSGAVEHVKFIAS